MLGWWLGVMRSTGRKQGVGVLAAVPRVMLACVFPPRAVLHSGEYFLFESDSEEEESSTPEEQRPAQQSAFQVRAGGLLGPAGAMGGTEGT